MRREAIIVGIIIVFIIIGHIVTQNYTKKFFYNISEKLDSLEGMLYDENSDSEELKRCIDDIQEKWREKFHILAYYIEHDELEKIELELTSVSANVNSADYIECIEYVQRCKFMLEHIEDKDSFKLVNIF